MGEYGKSLVGIEIVRLFVISIIAALLSTVGLRAQTPATKVDFSPLVWDFGAIREVDGPVRHTFVYKNVGDKPYIIYDVATSCGCTTPAYDRSPLMAGSVREMEIVFDPTNQPGRIEKSILVRGNVEGGTTVLKIRATVEPRPRTIADDYPATLTDGVRLQDIVVEIGTSPNSKPTTATLGIVNTGPKEVEVAIDNANLPKWAAAKAQNPTYYPRG